MCEYPFLHHTLATVFAMDLRVGHAFSGRLLIAPLICTSSMCAMCVRSMYPRHANRYDGPNPHLTGKEHYGFVKPSRNPWCRAYLRPEEPYPFVSLESRHPLISTFVKPQGKWVYLNDRRISIDHEVNKAPRCTSSLEHDRLRQSPRIDQSALFQYVLTRQTHALQIPITDEMQSTFRIHCS